MRNLANKIKDSFRGLGNRLIKYFMQGQRPEAWEDDISRYALDARPFKNQAAPNQLDKKLFSNPSRLAVMESLLAGKELTELIELDSYPIPSSSDREGYLPEYDGAYWMSGLEDYLKVMAIVDKYNVNVRSVFDFGCASGRVLRHFAAQTKIPELWGSDINARHIRWMYEFMPNTVKPIFNSSIPSLPIRDNSIDVLVAFSVFTHLDTFETSWLAELQRVLHDDGIAYITVHNENTWDYLAKLPEDRHDRVIKTLLKCDDNALVALQKPLIETRTVYRYTLTGPYRALVFHSDNYIRKVWGRFFAVLDILPSHHANQSVVVLGKK